MASIKLSSLSDASFDVQAESDPASAFVKYLKSAPAELVLATELISQWESELAQTRLTETSLGVTFKHPVLLGSTLPKLTLNAGLCGKFSIHAKAGASITGENYYGEAIKVPAGKACVTLTLQATLGAGINPKAGDLSFGFKAGGIIELSYSQPFDATVKLGEAIVQTVANFRLPAAGDDLSALLPGSVATAGGSGSFSISAAYSASVAPNLVALATPDAVPVGNLALSANASVGVKGTATFTGDYQVRAYRPDAGDKVHFGYHHGKKTALGVQFSANAGVDATVNQQSVLDQFLSKISQDPTLNAEKLAALHLPAAEIKAMEAAIKGSLDRSFSLSVGAGLNFSDAAGEFFRFSYAPQNLQPQGREWIHHALNGEPGELLAQDTQQLASQGITPEASGVNHAIAKGCTLKLNLLGIGNYASFSQLLQDSSILYEDGTGTLTIANKSTARKISLAMSPLSDATKLRRILLENVFFALNYTASTLSSSQQLSVAHDFFESRLAVDSRNFAEGVAALQALSLISAQKRDELLAKPLAGNSLFWLSAAFDNEQSRNLLLTGPLPAGPWQPKPQKFFEDAGRQALVAITESLPAYAYRAQLIGDDATWQQLTNAGTLDSIRQIPAVQILRAPEQGTIAADYLAIRWWSKAMHELGLALLEFEKFLTSQNPPDRNSTAFKQVWKNFVAKSNEAAKDSQTPFAEPWGVVAMHLAANAHDKAIGALQTPGINLKEERP